MAITGCPFCSAESEAVEEHSKLARCAVFTHGDRRFFLRSGRHITTEHTRRPRVTQKRFARLHDAGESLSCCIEAEERICLPNRTAQAQHAGLSLDLIAIQAALVFPQNRLHVFCINSMVNQDADRLAQVFNRIFLDHFLQVFVVAIFEFDAVFLDQWSAPCGFLEVVVMENLGYRWLLLQAKKPDRA